MSFILSELARKLYAAGVEAHELVVPVPGKGSQVGLMVVGVGFFPLWEINEPVNLGLVACLDFAALKAKRPVNWEMVEPGLWDESARGMGE